MKEHLERVRNVKAVCTHLTESLSASADLVAAGGFAGLDFVVTPDNVDCIAQDLELVAANAGRQIDVRFHAYFSHAEFGHLDSERASESLAELKKAVCAVSASGGRFITVHIGFNPLAHGDVSFNTAAKNLAALVSFAEPFDVTICVENLRRGLTSVPELYVELIELSNASSTFDIGHALSSEDGQQNGFPFEAVARLGDKIKNAHVYQAEDDQLGHIAPDDLSVIAPALDALKAAGCRWWVIELGDPGDIRTTNALLDDYFRAAPSDEDPISAILAV